MGRPLTLHLDAVEADLATITTILNEAILNGTAVWSFAAAALLWTGRDAFHVRHDPVNLRSALLRVPLVLVGTAIAIIASVAIAAPNGASFGL